MIDETFVQEIAKLATESIGTVEIEGRTYSNTSLQEITPKLPKPIPLSMRTLIGFVNFIKANIDEIETEKCFIKICDQEKIHLISDYRDDDFSRYFYVECNLSERIDFHFGHFYAVEEFIIKLHSQFGASPDKLKLLDFVSKMTLDSSVQYTDDGVGQTVAVKKGISGALKEKKAAPVIVNLAPYRTFRELNQPISSFLFRVRKDDESSNINCGLFQADGDVWKIEAIETIRKYLVENIKDILIVA